MSLYGALNIGVAGLDATSAALSATSSNIANVNTVGYKGETANFETFLNTPGLSANSSAGVSALISQNVTAQGLPVSTSSPTDLSISGNGFFVVSTDTSGTTQEYTRAGSFTPDADGNLKNAAGLYLMGWKLDQQGNIPTNASDVSLVNVSNLAGKAQPSTTIAIQANLQSGSTVDATYTAGDMTSGAVSPDFTRTLNVYDSQGAIQPVTFSFIKTAANTWAYEASYAGSAANLTASGPIAQGTLAFNPDGTLANVNGASPATGKFNITVPWNLATSGLAPQTIAVNFGDVGTSDGLSQFDTPSTLSSTIDGSAFGSVTGVTVAKDGTVTAQFSNGLSQNVYKIPLATFTAPDGLAQVNGDAYIVTNNSGVANINLADAGSAGAINAQTLESSTVDLATEFTNLITTQRAYSAAARIVTTADQMLQQLEQMPTQ